MRKIIFVGLLMVGIFCSGAFAANSDDVYLRRDVFEARMDAFEAKMNVFEIKMDAFVQQIQLENEKFRTEIKSEIQGVKSELQSEIKNVKSDLQGVKSELQSEIKNVKSDLQSEIQNVKSDLREQIARIDERTGNTLHVVYWILASLAVIIALPSVQKLLIWWYDSKKRSAQSVTLDDVKKLLDERLGAVNSPQVVGK